MDSTCSGGIEKSKAPVAHARGLERGRYRTATVSTYMVGFLPFLAEYFGGTHFAQCLQPVGRDSEKWPQPAAYTRGWERTFNRTATARERYHERRCIALRFLAVAVRFWFRLCRVRESVPLFQSRTNVFHGVTKGDEDAERKTVSRRKACPTWTKPWGAFACQLCTPRPAFLNGA